SGRRELHGFPAHAVLSCVPSLGMPTIFSMSGARVLRQRLCKGSADRTARGGSGIASMCVHPSLQPREATVISDTIEVDALKRSRLAFSHRAAPLPAPCGPSHD